MNNLDLFKANQYIVDVCYNKLGITDVVKKNEDDIKQEGLIALWKGVCSFDPSVSDNLVSYLYTCVKNAMINWITHETKIQQNCLSMDEPLSGTNDSDDYITLADILQDDNYDEENNYKLIEDILDTYKRFLTKKKHKNIDSRVVRCRAILYELLNEGKQGAKTAQIKYSLNRTTVSNTLVELREALKTEYKTRYTNRRKTNNGKT